MLALAAIVTAKPLLSSRFVPQATKVRRLASPPRLSAALDTFEKAGWQSALDELPVFTIASKEGQPMQYSVDGRPLAIFYADVEAAKTEFAAAQRQYPDLGCDLVSVGLGSAYRLSLDGKAMVVPGLAELRAAGAPEDAQPMGQELPLFGCMQMSRKGDEGQVLPLFMSYTDCAAAVAEAANGGTPDDPVEIAGFALSSVIVDPAPGAFSFVAPSSSLQHIQAYLGAGVYWRPVDDNDNLDES